MVCSQIGLSIIHTSKVHTKTYSNLASEICCHPLQSCTDVCTYVCMFLKTVTSKEIQFYEWVWSPAFALRKRGQLGMELEGSPGTHRTGITSRQLLICWVLRPLTLKHQRWARKHVYSNWDQTSDWAKESQVSRPLSTTSLEVIQPKHMLEIWQHKCRDGRLWRNQETPRKSSVDEAMLMGPTRNQKKPTRPGSRSVCP